MRPCDEKQRSGHDRQGPGGTSASRTIGQANLAGVNLEPAPDPPRGFNARERRVVDLPRDGRNLTKISATLSIGYKTAANIVSPAKPKLRPPRSHRIRGRTERRP
jgi:two-component system, NarL family, invasion response regulator UvrY